MSGELALQLLDADEEQKILIEWNKTQSDFPADKTIFQLFEHQVSIAPKHVALFLENNLLTYEELNQKANQLAHYLRTLGAKADDLIGICLDPSLELMVCILGVLKAGSAYVPLDPSYPAERLQFMLDDAKAKIVITKSIYAELFKKNKAEVLSLETHKTQMDEQATFDPVQVSLATHLAYVIYTSGSTGRPKGVMITHRNVVNFIHWFSQALAISDQDIVDFSSSISFDFSVATTLFPLCMGAKIAICPQSKRQDPYSYIDHLLKSQATIIKITPSRFRQLNEFITPQHKFDSLKWLVFGGESILANDLHNWLLQFPHHKILNEYGPTETTVATSWLIVDKDNLSRFQNNIPIGRPALNSQIYILNEGLQPVPIGQTGELYVGGVGVGKGYLNQPKLTAERFIKNPFSCDPKATLYKTGDLCHYLADGNIEFLGRIDHQVKIRGFRVEIAEIEACLNMHEHIQTALIIPREHSGGEKQLIAYYVIKKGHSNPTTNQLRI